MEKEENTVRQIVPVSMRVYSDDRESYKKIKDELSLPTDAQVFAQLIQTFYDPVKVKDETADLREQLSLMTDKAVRLEGENAQLKEELAELKRKLDEAETQRNENAEAASRLQLEHEAELDNLKLKENQHVLTILPDNWTALEMVAARETQRRGKPWSVSHVVNYFVYFRFIKGSLNGDLKSLSDSELKAAGVEPVKKVLDI